MSMTELNIIDNLESKDHEKYLTIWLATVKVEILESHVLSSCLGTYFHDPILL